MSLIPYEAPKANIIFNGKQEEGSHENQEEGE